MVYNTETTHIDYSAAILNNYNDFTIERLLSLMEGNLINPITKNNMLSTIIPKEFEYTTKNNKTILFIYLISFN